MMKYVLLLLGLLTSSAWASKPLYSTVITNDGANTYFRLDESSGNFTDIIGSQICVVAGGITYSQTGALSDGSGNTAAKFNGSTGTCAKTSLGVGSIYQPRIPVGDGWSFEAWYKPTNVGARAPIADLATDDRYEWEIGTGPTGVAYATFYGAGTSGLGCRDGNHGDVDSTTTVAVAGSWFHIVVTTVGGGQVTCGDSTPNCDTLASAKMYINGHLNNSTTTFDTSTIEHSFCTQSQDMRLNIASFIPSVPDGFADGTIDEISFYSIELSPAQVLCHYNAGIGHPEFGPAGTQCTGRLDWPFTASLGNEYFSEPFNGLNLATYLRGNQIGVKKYGGKNTPS